MGRRVKWRGVQGEGREVQGEVEEGTREGEEV